MQTRELGTIIALALVVPAAARADDKQDIEKLIRLNVHAASFVERDGVPMPDGMIDKPVIEPATSTLMLALCGCGSDSATHKLDKVTVVVEPSSRVAWFHGSYKATYHPLVGDKQLPVSTVRINGVAIDDKGWKLAAIMYARTMSDAQLSKYASTDFYYADPKLASMAGDPAVTAVVESWFRGRLKQHAAELPLRASGTAPAETAADADAIRLASAWDRLGLRRGEVVAHVWNGAIGFVLADVGLPAKGRKGAAPMRLGAVVVRRAGPQGTPAWRWVSLSFGAVEPYGM